MKIYTKTGDNGSTMLFGGTRVSKDHIRVECYGCIDELNSHVGLVGVKCKDDSNKALLEKVQNFLFNIGSHLATDPSKEKAKGQLPELESAEIRLVEKEIDRLTKQLPELKNFILPGGHESVAQCHITRTVCRRCERVVTALSNHEHVHPVILPYLNRLSDYLFTLARFLAKENGVDEIKWRSKA